MADKKWTTNDIPDQSGRIAIVTGSSSGIGLETARALAAHSATIILAIRDTSKGHAALDEINQLHPEADVHLMTLDLADLNSVTRFTDEYKKSYSHLDLLINNAGIMIPPYSKTKDGFEMQFGTNHLGHFALTGLLLNLLLQTPKSRIVNVSSGAHKWGNLNFDDLNWEKRKYKKWKAYGDSKLANIYFTYELQKKLEAAGSTTIVTAAHPGYTATELQRTMAFSSVLNSLFAQNTTMGALPTLYAATAPDVSGADYFGPSGFQEARGYPKKVNSNPLSHDEKNANQLWEASEK